MGREREVHAQREIGMYAHRETERCMHTHGDREVYAHTHTHIHTHTHTHRERERERERKRCMHTHIEREVHAHTSRNIHTTTIATPPPQHLPSTLTRPMDTSGTPTRESYTHQRTHHTHRRIPGSSSRG